MKDYAGKVVYIVGGSSGIGLAAAKQFASLGADVFIFSRTIETLDRAVEEIAGEAHADSQKVSSRRLDVTDGDAVDEVMARAVVEFGAPDVLINCAGRAYPRAFEEIGYDQLDESMKVHLYGIWSTIRALLPHMEAKGGEIVNVASMASFLGVFGYTDYCASKFALLGFSEALRSEFKPRGIGVSVLCPPDTQTPGFDIENKTKPAETVAATGMSIVMQPDEVARALIRGMRRGTFVIVPGLFGKAVYLAKRLVPGLVERMMDRDIRKAQARKS